MLVGAKGGGKVGEGDYGTMAAAGQLSPTVAAKGNNHNQYCDYC